MYEIDRLGGSADASVSGILQTASQIDKLPQNDTLVSSGLCGRCCARLMLHVKRDGAMCCSQFESPVDR